ncbi:MAG: exonuclease [Rhodospirillales bacterium]|nr:exonuclease [Rhodospirillales bacterium]
MSPRAGLALAFALLAVLAVAALYLAPSLEPPARSLLALILVIGVGVLAFILDQRLMVPATQLANEVEFQARTKGAQRGLIRPGPHWLGALLPAIEALVQVLQGRQDDLRQALDHATAKSEEQKRWLEVILVDLSEGVLVCNMSHQILLYNQAAIRLFEGSDALGLGRPLFNLVSRAPVLHTLDLLQHRRRPASDDEATVPFVCATADSRLMLQGRLGLIKDANAKITAYVVTFSDISGRVAEIEKGDEVRRAMTRELRQPIANLRAAAETLAGYPDMAPAVRQSFDQVILDEGTRLSDRLEALAREYRGHALGRWPMADLHAADLVNCIDRRLAKDRALALTLVGIPLWLHGDSHLLMLGFEQLLRRLHAKTGVAAFDAETMLGDKRVYLDLAWEGPTVSAQQIEAWLDEPLADADGPYRLRDVFERHGSEMWCQARGGRAVLRVPLLAPAGAPIKGTAPDLPPRPEFYDFGLMSAHSDAGRLSERPLRALTFVVFDTETTGLKPSEGDEIISIGAVRVVNGRLLTGETFERLVNPGRTIPKDSIRFHGITDAMVKDKPPIGVVLPQFKAFAGDAVLVAHNAAFDMKFLQLKEKATGVAFANPVLDTMLLSLLADAHLEDHSLDGVAQRFVIDIPDRHTALGDALATAAVLVRLIEIVETKGIATFGQVMKAANMAAEVRARQARI